MEHICKTIDARGSTLVIVRPCLTDKGIDYNVEVFNSSSTTAEGINDSAYKVNMSDFKSYAMEAVRDCHKSLSIENNKVIDKHI